MVDISRSLTRAGPRLLHTLWRYKWMSLLIVVASIAIGYTLTLQFAGEPTATARMVLADPRGNAVLRQGVTSEATFIRYLEQRSAVARSQRVLSRVGETLEATDPDLDVSDLRSRVQTRSEPSGDIVIVASGREPTQAAAIANAVVDAYRAETLLEHINQRDSTISAVEEARQQIVDRGGEESADSAQESATDEALTRLEIRVADILVDTSTFRDGVLYSEPALTSETSATLAPVRSTFVAALLGLILALAIGLVRDEQTSAIWLGQRTAGDTASEPLPEPSVGGGGNR